MSYDIVADRQGVLELRARTEAYADYLYGILQKHGHSVSRDRTNRRVIFLKNPRVEGFRTADQLPLIRQRILEEAKPE